MYWYSCMVCGRNQIDVLHHIVCPSVRHYTKGEHNKSVFNSCPIHNQVCHIGNEAYLYSDDTVRLLLKKTLQALIELGYSANERDREFLKTYSHLYDKSDLEMVE